ncbi:MAG: glycosyltransferase family 4 protein [Cyanobacteria bacterium]|nr:glycosyltransferase family 4 protein [Cyanobacteriota bacterium]
MKLLVVSHTYIVDLNLDKLRALVELSPDVEIVVIVPKVWVPGGVQSGTVKSEHKEEDRLRVIPVVNFGREKGGLLTFGWEIIKVVREFKPDIIQVEQGSFALTYTQMILVNLLLQRRAKNIFFTWWNLRHNQSPLARFLEWFNLHHTHGAICGNQDGAEILRDRGFLGPLAVIPQLGVDLEQFSRTNEPELMRELDLSQDEFVIGFTGRLVPEKGLQTLMKALSRVEERMGELKRSWKCIFIGRGPMKADLIEWAKNSKVEQRIRIIEDVPHDQVPRYMSLMSALVLPSETSPKVKALAGGGWSEQFGHVLIEAMACEVPIIGSSSGNIPHVIGDSGLVFSEGDADALADSITRLMGQPSLARDLSRRGYERCMTKFTNHALAKETLEFYLRLHPKTCQQETL